MFINYVFIDLEFDRHAVVFLLYHLSEANMLPMSTWGWCLVETGGVGVGLVNL
jgi:hypothetical protein